MLPRPGSGTCPLQDCMGQRAGAFSSPSHDAAAPRYTAAQLMGQPAGVLWALTAVLTGLECRADAFNACRHLLCPAKQQRCIPVGVRPSNEEVTLASGLLPQYGTSTSPWRILLSRNELGLNCSSG